MSNTMSRADALLAMLRNLNDREDSDAAPELVAGLLAERDELRRRVDAAITELQSGHPDPRVACGFALAVLRSGP